MVFTETNQACIHVCMCVHTCACVVCGCTIHSVRSKQGIWVANVVNHP